MTTLTGQEKAKCRSYEQCIWEVDASFVSTIFSTMDSMGKHAAALYKRTASLIAEKTGEKYGVVMASIHCRISFTLVRASIMCLRGSRWLFSSISAFSDSVTLVVAESINIPISTSPSLPLIHCYFKKKYCAYYISEEVGNN